MNIRHGIRRAWSALTEIAASMTPPMPPTLTIGDFIRIAEAERIRMEAQQQEYETALFNRLIERVRQQIYDDIRTGRIVIDEFVPPPSMPSTEDGAAGTQARQPARGST